MKIAEIRKALSTAVTVAGDIVADQAVDGTLKHWLIIGISIAGVVLTYFIPNAPAAAAGVAEPLPPMV